MTIEMIADHLGRLEIAMEKGFEENKKQHEELNGLLFKSNGKPSLVSRVERNTESSNDLTIDTKVNTSFIKKLKAQMSVWKYIISVIGIGNIIMGINLLINN